MWKETYNHSRDARALRGCTGTQILHEHGELIFYINICVSLWEGLHTWERTCKRLYKCICLDTLISWKSLYMYKKTYICAKRPYTHWQDTRARERVRVFQNKLCSLCRGSAQFRAHMRACESCLWCQWVMSLVWKNGFSLVNGSCHTPHQGA